MTQGLNWMASVEPLGNLFCREAGGKDDRLKTTPGPAPCQAVLCFKCGKGMQEIAQCRSLALNYGLVTLQLMVCHGSIRNPDVCRRRIRLRSQPPATDGEQLRPGNRAPVLLLQPGFLWAQLAPGPEPGGRCGGRAALGKAPAARRDSGTQGLHRAQPLRRPSGQILLQIFMILRDGHGFSSASRATPDKPRCAASY